MQKQQQYAKKHLKGIAPKVHGITMQKGHYQYTV
jgi:hypothetical protein